MKKHIQCITDVTIRSHPYMALNISDIGGYMMYSRIDSSKVFLQQARFSSLGSEQLRSCDPMAKALAIVRILIRLQQCNVLQIQ
jgi:hypothetical protein